MTTDNEIKHQEYLRGRGAGELWNEGLWDFDGGQEPEAGGRYREGFEAATGLTIEQAFAPAEAPHA